MPHLKNCSCGASRENAVLICSKCAKSYPFTQKQVTTHFGDYLQEKISRIKKGNMYAAEQLIHFYEKIDPQVSEIIRAVRDAKNV